MAIDFFVNDDGDIRFEDDSSSLSPYFIIEMQYLCGETGEVYDVQYNTYGDGIDKVIVKLDDGDVLIDEWGISNLMIEPEECAVISDDVDKLRDFLSNK